VLQSGSADGPPFGPRQQYHFCVACCKIQFAQGFSSNISLLSLFLNHWLFIALSAPLSRTSWDDRKIRQFVWAQELWTPYQFRRRCIYDII
jgi:hypothetical protein